MGTRADTTPVKPIRLVVLRHGQSLVNAARLTGTELDIIQRSAGSGDDDNGLSPVGEEQAKTSAQILRHMGFYVVMSFSSPQPRAVQTNMIIQDELQPEAVRPVHMLRSLRELWRGGQEGQPRAQVEGATDDDRQRIAAALIKRQLLEGSDFRHMEDAESFGELGKRALRAWDLVGQIATREAGYAATPDGRQPIVLVTTHGGTLRHGLQELTGQEYPFGNAEGMVIEYVRGLPENDDCPQLEATQQFIRHQ